MKKNIQNEVFSSDRIKKESKILKSKKFQPLIVCLIGILIFLSSYFIKNYFKITKPFFITFLEAFITISIPIITAGIVSFIFSWPDLKQYIEKIIFNILTDSDYISILNSEKILDLRKKCTKFLYTDILRDDKNIIDSLSNLENEIEKSLQNIFYKKYKNDIVCTEIKKRGYIIKETEIDLIIKNPKKECDSFEFDCTSFLFDIPGIDKQELRKLIKFTVSYQVNEGKIHKEDLTSEYSFKIDENDISNVKQCKYKTNLVNKDNKIYSIKIIDELNIHIEEKRLLPIEDNISLYRLNYPTENFELCYKYNGNPNIECYGSIFGTMTELNDEGIYIKNKGNVSIIKCNKWMLKSNGIVIVLKSKK